MSNSENPDDPQFREPLPDGASPPELIENNDRYFVAMEQQLKEEWEQQLKEEYEEEFGAPPSLEAGDTLRVEQTPAFSRVRVTKLGSFNTIGDDTELIGTEVIMWTGDTDNHNPFSDNVEVRGVLTPGNADAWQAGELSWLSADGEVEIIAPPTYIGRPEDYIPATAPVELPENTGRDMFYNWPSLIWDSMPLYRGMVPLTDAQSALELILCALKVAPPVPDVQAFLLAGLKARYAEYVKDGFWDEPWLTATGPAWDYFYCH